MIFLISCIMSKTDLSVQRDGAGKYAGEIRQHALLIETFGPSATLAVAPEGVRFAVGGDLAFGALWESMCGGDSWCDWLAPSLRYSILGLQLLEYQHERGSNYVGLASPYAQLHIPFGCEPFNNTRSEKNRDPEPCLSLFGSVEYQNRLQASNQVFWGVGLSYAFLIYPR